ncbi:MAG TPA: carbohydrate porin [Stellaceae bacterium]|nr:carbohydrate porin [Stellaceae bacterium]
MIKFQTKTLVGGVMAVTALALIGGATPAAAQATATEPGGAMTSIGNSLLAHGIYLRGDYIGEFAANPSGGIKQSDRYAGQVDAGADFDLNTIAGIPGAAVHLTFSQRHGQNLAAKDIGSSVSVQEVYGGGQTYRLSELSWDQALFNDKLEFLVGRIDVGSDFAASSIYCNFQTNSVCGNPSLFGQDNSLTYFPVPTWGGRFTVKPTPQYYIQSGAYEASAYQGLSTQHGFDFSTDKSTGVIIPFEVGYQTSFRTDAMPRHYRLGGFYDSAQYNDPYFDTTGRSQAVTGGSFQTHSGRTTLFALFDQMIWRPDPAKERGLILFGGLTTGTSSDQVADYYLQLGLLQRGTFEGRDADTVGLVVTDLKFSQRTENFIIDSRRLAGGTGSPNANMIMMEVNYGAQVTPWLRFVPNLQYIINPDNINEPTRKTNIPDAFVIGLKMAVSLPSLIGLPTRSYSH